MAKILRRSLSRSRGPAQVADFFVTRFWGLTNAVTDPKEVDKGVAIDALNWLTGSFNDHIELRPGMKVVGTKQTGTGKITGLGVGIRNDGRIFEFRSYGRKVEYRDTSLETNDWIEVGSNLLPTAADGEDVSFAFYHGLAGAFMYISSPNSSIYKIPLANPDSAVDQNSTTYRGKIKFTQNRMILWDRKTQSTGFTDKTTPYFSYIDKDVLSAFTQVTAEAVGGSGTHRTGTLSAKAGDSKRTCFNVIFTDAGTGEIMKDDGSGNIIGSAGGTGTINYATMAYDITFAGTATSVTVDYQWEDATSQGVCDFSFSTPRTAGQGNFYRQDDGGDLMTVLTFNYKEYCLHTLKTWAITIEANDTQSTNLVYRANLGIPYWRSGVESGNGMVILDYFDKGKPGLRILTFDLTGQVVPLDLSDVLDLSSYVFDYAVVWDWGNYYFICCQKKVLGTAETFNSVIFVWNKRNKNWDKLNYNVSVLANVDGKLHAGDPISNNVYELFSGYDDDGEIINNYWISGQMNLGVEGKKKVFKFVIDGYISINQKLKISLSYDNGNFVEIGGNDENNVHTYAIEGSGSYIDVNLGTIVGSTTVGEDMIGSSSLPNAFHFAREFTIASDQFEYVQVKFEAMDVGALQINYFGFKDIRYRGRKKLPNYYG